MLLLPKREACIGQNQLSFGFSASNIEQYRNGPRYIVGSQLLRIQSATLEYRVLMLALFMKDKGQSIGTGRCYLFQNIPWTETAVDSCIVAFSVGLGQFIC